MWLANVIVLLIKVHVNVKLGEVRLVKLGKMMQKFRRIFDSGHGWRDSAQNALERARCSQHAQFCSNLIIFFFR